MCQFEQDSFILKFLIVTMDKSPPRLCFMGWRAERQHAPTIPQEEQYRLSNTTFSPGKTRKRAGKALPDLTRWDFLQVSF